MLVKRHPELENAVDSVVKISLRQKWRFALLQRHMHATAKQARKRQIQLDLEESREEGRVEERGVWQNIVANKDMELADKDAENARLREILKVNGLLP